MCLLKAWPCSNLLWRTLFTVIGFERIYLAFYPFAIQIDQGQLPETDMTSEPSADEQDEGGGETREYVPWYGMEVHT